jgi:hypothetical protein
VGPVVLFNERSLWERLGSTFLGVAQAPRVPEVDLGLGRRKSMSNRRGLEVSGRTTEETRLMSLSMDAWIGEMD